MPTFTRRHYYEMSKAIREQLADPAADRRTLENLASQLVRVFSTDNEKFQPRVFWRACGLEREPQVAATLEERTFRAAD